MTDTEPVGSRTLVGCYEDVHPLSYEECYEFRGVGFYGDKVAGYDGHVVVVEAYYHVPCCGGVDEAEKMSAAALELELGESGPRSAVGARRCIGAVGVTFALDEGVGRGDEIRDEVVVRHGLLD